MEILTEATFRKRIKTSPGTGYLFFGEEDYLKSHAAKLLSDTVLSGSLPELNHIKLDSLDYTPEKLLDILSSPPMFGERKLVELFGLDFANMRAAEQNALFDILPALREYDYNTLLISIASGGIDEGRLPSRPSALLSRFGEFLTPVRFEKCSPSRLAGWAARHFRHNGAAASPEICAKIIEYCGRDMYTLAGEIAKVSFHALAHGRAEVTEEDILKAAIPDSDYDAFALANALTAADRPRALYLLDLMKLRRLEPFIIMGEVSRVFCDLMSVRLLADGGYDPRAVARELKMHEYRAGLYYSAAQKTTVSALSRLLSLAAEADAEIKLSPVGYTSIELFICSI